MKNRIVIGAVVIMVTCVYILPSFAIDKTEIVRKGKETSVFIIAEFKINDKDPVPLQKTGTGFVIDTTKSAGLIVITNRHILEHRINDRLLVPNRILVKVNFSDVEQSFHNARIVGLHNHYDIGILYPENLLKIPKDAESKSGVSNGRQYYKWETKSFLLENSIIDDNEIKEGLEVFFSGYPLALGAEKIKNFPITRKGMVARVVPGEKELIIDGFASSGNSGSPVYCVIDETIKLLGIQKGVYPDRFAGYDENGNLISLNSFSSGLLIVIKASVIRDFVYELIEKGKYKGNWSE